MREMSNAHPYSSVFIKVDFDTIMTGSVIDGHGVVLKEV